LLPLAPFHILQEILEVEQVTEESQGLSLTAENVDQVGAATASPVAMGSQASSAIAVGSERN
jgi:hypothetical protein